MSRPVNAPMVSKLLKAGGLPKAGRYTAWGYVNPEGQSQDGFLVIGPRAYAFSQGDRTVDVCFTKRGERARVEYERAIEILTAEGYVIKERKNAGLGGDYNFEVIDRNDA